jgi:hypothetical protein
VPVVGEVAGALDGFGAGVGLELSDHVLHVGLHGVHRYEQLVGDLPVRHGRRQVPQHGPLAVTQRLERETGRRPVGCGGVRLEPQQRADVFGVRPAAGHGADRLEDVEPGLGEGEHEAALGGDVERSGSRVRIGPDPGEISGQREQLDVEPLADRRPVRRPGRQPLDGLDGPPRAALRQRDARLEHGPTRRGDRSEQVVGVVELVVAADVREQQADPRGDEVLADGAVDRRAAQPLPGPVEQRERFVDLAAGTEQTGEFDEGEDGDRDPGTVRAIVYDTQLGLGRVEFTPLQQGRTEHGTGGEISHRLRSLLLLECLHRPRCETDGVVEAALGPAQLCDRRAVLDRREQRGAGVGWRARSDLGIGDVTLPGRGPDVHRGGEGHGIDVVGDAGGELAHRCTVADRATRVAVRERAPRARGGELHSCGRVEPGAAERVDAVRQALGVLDPTVHHDDRTQPDRLHRCGPQVVVAEQSLGHVEWRQPIVQVVVDEADAVHAERLGPLAGPPTVPEREGAFPLCRVPVGGPLVQCPLMARVGVAQQRSEHLGHQVVVAEAFIGTQANDREVRLLEVTEPDGCVRTQGGGQCG